MTASVLHRPLAQHHLIEPWVAHELSELFKLLANETRLRILHALIRTPDLSVTELGREVGLKPQALSNQLRRLVDRGIVTGRRRGLEIHYRVVDPCIVELFDFAMCATTGAVGEPGAATCTPLGHPLFQRITRPPSPSLERR
jgi:DNA-binding transcriptional ArsR family regulator